MDRERKYCCRCKYIGYLYQTAAGLAQSVERLTAEREVAGSIPGAGPILRVLKYLRNEGTVFALQTAGPSRDSDDHVEMAVPSPVGDVKIVSPISTFVLNTLTLKKKRCVLISQKSKYKDNNCKADTA